MPALDQQRLEEGTTRLSDAGELERIEKVRSVTWPDGYVPWEGLEWTHHSPKPAGVFWREGPQHH